MSRGVSGNGRDVRKSPEIKGEQTATWRDTKLGALACEVIVSLIDISPVTTAEEQSVEPLSLAQPFLHDQRAAVRLVRGSTTTDCVAIQPMVLAIVRRSHANLSFAAI